MTVQATSPAFVMPARTRLGVNAVWNAVGWTSLAVYSFLTTAIVFRSVGATDYGIWATVAALRGFLLFVDGGLAVGVIRDAARAAAGERDAEVRIASARLVYLVAAAMALLVGVLFASVPSRLLDSSAVDGGVATAVTVAFSVEAAVALMMSPLTATLRGTGRYASAGIVSVVQSAVGIAVLVFLVGPLGLVGAALAAVISRFAAAAVAILAVRASRIIFVRVRRDGAKIDEVVRYSAPIWLIAIGTQLGLGTDVPIVGYFHGPDAASRYAVGAAIPTLAIGLLYVLLDAALPRLSTGLQSAETQRLIVTLTRIGTVLRPRPRLAGPSQ